MAHESDAFKGSGLGDDAVFSNFQDKNAEGAIDVAAQVFAPDYHLGASTAGAKSATVVPDAPGSRNLKPGVALTPNPDAAGPSAEGKGS